MKWTNYHSHSSFSDGKGDPELYVKSAIEKGMYAYGFSCHSPLPFESGWNMKFERLRNYILEINRLKQKYHGSIKLYLSLEADYVKNMIGLDQFAKYNLDYTLGSVHFLEFFSDGKVWDFDRSNDWFKKGLEELFGNDIKRLVEFYYQQVTDMIRIHKPDLVGHFDLIKKFNGKGNYFDESEGWYKEIVYGALDVVSSAGSILEVNTRGVLKNLCSEFYPSNFILKRCHEKKIPLTLSADSHDPEDVMALLPEARELLRKIGYTEVSIFDEKGWSPTPI
ncbi:MAG: histidinol-phosphatase [Bacteroidales bacterium]